MMLLTLFIIVSQICSVAVLLLKGIILISISLFVPLDPGGSERILLAAGAVRVSP